MRETLTRVQLRALTAGLMQRGSGRRTMKSRVLLVIMALLLVYAACGVGFMMGSLGWLVAKPLAAAGLSWLYFALFAGTAFVLAGITTLLMTQRTLYGAKDNELLLALPFSPREILLARMAGLAVSAYVLTALVLLPAGIVWQICVGFAGAGQVLCFALTGLCLPLAALAVACLLGWALASLSGHVRNKTAISVAAALGFLALYFTGMARLQTALVTLAENGENAAAAVRVWAAPLYACGLAMQGNAGALAGVVLACGGAFLLVLHFLEKSFFALVTMHHGAPKAEYREKIAVRWGAAAALWRNQLRHFASCPGWVLNGGLGAVFSLVLGVSLVVKPGFLTETVAGMGLPADVAGAVLAPLLAAGLCLCTGMCMVSAACVSLEAKTLWLLQSCPLSGGMILRSMARLELTLTVPASAFGALAGAWALRLNAGQTLAVLAACLSFAWLHAAMGVLFNVLMPKFDWMNETQAVKQSASTFFAMFAGFALVLLPGVVYAVGGAALGDTVYLLLCAAGYTAGALALERWMSTAGARQFAAL